MEGMDPVPVWMNFWKCSSEAEAEVGVEAEAEVEVEAEVEALSAVPSSCDAICSMARDSRDVWR
jgi:hypothetical protein